MAFHPSVAQAGASGYFSQPATRRYDFRLLRALNRENVKRYECKADRNPYIMEVQPQENLQREERSQGPTGKVSFAQPLQLCGGASPCHLPQGYLLNAVFVSIQMMKWSEKYIDFWTEIFHPSLISTVRPYASSKDMND